MLSGKIGNVEKFFPFAHPLVEFLELFSHNLLLFRDVYPSAAFHTAKFYGISVPFCRHPSVQKFLASARQMALELLNKKILKEYVLILLNEGGQELERFVFEVGYSKCGIPSWAIKPEKIQETEGLLKQFYVELPSVVDIELPSCQPQSFNVVLNASGCGPLSVELEALPFKDNVHFQENDDHLTHCTTSWCLIPIKSLDSLLFKLQLFVIEKQEVSSDFPMDVF